MSSIEILIRQLADQNLQINLWKTRSGGYQANVKELAGAGWTCVTDPDPLFALVTALRQRATRHPGREVIGDPEPEQIDIEDAIARVATVDDDFEALL